MEKHWDAIFLGVIHRLNKENRQGERIYLDCGKSHLMIIEWRGKWSYRMVKLEKLKSYHLSIKVFGDIYGNKSPKWIREQIKLFAKKGGGRNGSGKGKS